MKQNENIQMPTYAQLVEATFVALRELGGSGKNDEINAKATSVLKLSDEILDIPHLNSTSLSEIHYRLAWARTLLKNYGAIANSARSVWTITPNFSNKKSVDGLYIQKNFHQKAKPNSSPEISDYQLENSGLDLPDEIKPWRKKLYEVLIKMNPYSFEKLSQRLLRECGFDDVHVTKKIRRRGY